MKHIFTALVLLLSTTFAHSAVTPVPEHKWRLDIHGLSYHVDRCYRSCTKQYNETNPGLGLAYKLNSAVDIVGGVFHNSFEKRSTYFGINLGHKFGRFTPGIMLGSITGYTFDGREQRELQPAVLPNVSIDVDRYQLNVGFIPEDFGGKSAVFTLRAGIRF